MIIVRSPLRISLGGGGTDLPSYYLRHGGYVLSAAIDKYVFVALNKPFSTEYILKYSNYERTNDISEVRHPIIREALRIFTPNHGGVEISTMADIPSGTGLGSSGSFTTAILKALATYSGQPIHANDLARLACHLELELLKEPIGKQDQYIAAYGGFTEFHFHKDGEVSVNALPIKKEVVHDLEDNLLLFYTGQSRSASSILRDQDNKSKENEKTMNQNLDFIKELGLETKEALLSANTKKYGELMNEHWEHKKSRSNGITNSEIDSIYNLALKNGAVGGKLVGAGGGGFLMFYADDIEKLRSAMSQQKLSEVRFKFDFEGTSVVLN